MITNIVQFLHTTAAYQSAVFQLLSGEANFVAGQLDLKGSEPLPIWQGTNERTILPPPMGVGGSVMTSNYLFEFQKGRLTWVLKTDWMKKVSPPITNLAELVNRPSLLDSNGAYQLATQWLTRLSVDVPELERRFPHGIVQLPARKYGADGSPLPGRSNNAATPIFQICWGDKKPPMDRLNPVRVKLLATTKEAIDLHIGDAVVFSCPPLTITNAAELLGPLPSQRHFVEHLVGGAKAYETITNPDQTEIWLLRSHQETGDYTTNAPRTGAIKLKTKSARQFSEALLDFNSYAWTVQKLCMPDFGVRIRFTRGKDVAEFLLCYECDILEVAYNGRTSSENFDYGHNQLVRALQAIFPKDEIVNKLEFNDDKPEDLLKMFQHQ